MTAVLYFNGSEELKSVQPVRNAAFLAMGGVPSRHNSFDSFKRMVGKNADGVLVPVTRKIFRKANPSMHVCGAKCRHAKGHDCECSCGGKHHGAGG